jgi:tripartite-type tricarboxylate transporter receptor subunit TctC
MSANRSRPTAPSSLAAALALALTVAGGAAPALAESYPSKPVRILTGYPPGGASDVIGRVLTDHLTTALGQPFYLEGKPGAAGNVAGEILANAVPDGHTLYIAGLGNVAVNRELYGNLTYDPAKAYAPISLLVRFPSILEISAKLPVATYPEFVAYAKAAPKLNHGSPGIGTLPHLAAELLKTKLGFRSEHVAYRGSGPFANAMMQGEIEWAFDVPNTALTLSQNGFAKLLAVAWPTRYEAFPSLPTMIELGVPGFDATTWFALVAPAATPRPIIERLSAEVARGFSLPEPAARLRNSGLDPFTSTPEQTAAIFEATRATWSAVVRANHIKAE